MINIIGVDPGGTCGVAHFRRNDAIEQYFFSPSQLRGDEASKVLGDLITAQGSVIKSTIVVCERFIVGSNTARKTRVNVTQDIIGALQLVCRESGVEFLQQTAATAKKIVSNKMLHDIGWYRPSAPHAMDAARHVGTILHNRYPAVWLEMIRPIE